MLQGGGKTGAFHSALRGLVEATAMTAGVEEVAAARAGARQVGTKIWTWIQEGAGGKELIKSGDSGCRWKRVPDGRPVGTLCGLARIPL